MNFAASFFLASHIHSVACPRVCGSMAIFGGEFTLPAARGTEAASSTNPPARDASAGRSF